MLHPILYAMCNILHPIIYPICYIFRPPTSSSISVELARVVLRSSPADVPPQSNSTPISVFSPPAEPPTLPPQIVTQDPPAPADADADTRALALTLACCPLLPCCPVQTVSENLVSMMAHLGKMGQRPAAKAE